MNWTTWKAIGSVAVAVVVLLPAGSRADSVANDAEIQLVASIASPGSGEPITLEGRVLVWSEVATTPDGASLTGTCRTTGSGTGGSGTRYLLEGSEAQFQKVSGPLPADANLTCRAQLVQVQTGAVQSIRVRLVATTFADGHVTFSVGDVNPD